MTTFPEFLRRRRAELGLMQRDLAKAIGVDVPMYSRYEHGERRPKREQVVKLARLLDVDANYLVALWLAQQAHETIASDRLAPQASVMLRQMLAGDDTPLPTSDTPQPATPPAATSKPRKAPKRDLAARVRAGSKMPLYVTGDAAKVMDTIEDASIDCIITSPPCWHMRQLGKEGIDDMTDSQYLDMIAAMATQARRVLVPKGSMWLNLAAGDEPLAAIPERVVTMLVTQMGWTLRRTIVWQRHLPGSNIADTPLRDSHEFLYHFTPTDGNTLFDADALRQAYTEVARIKKDITMPDVWDIPYKRGPIDQYVAAPTELYRLPLLACCPTDGIMLDPYCGTGSACVAAYNEGRRAIGIDINADYVQRARRRVEPQTMSLFG